MGEIRKLATETDFEKFVDIVTNAYTGIMKNSQSEKQTFKEFLMKNQKENSSVNYFGLFRRNVLIAGMRIHYYEMNLHGKKTAIGGVGLVAVDLLHKKEGAAKELIENFLQLFKDSEVNIVALYPFRPDFYKKMGFGYGANLYQYLLNPASFPKGATKKHLYYAHEDDYKELSDCYNRYVDNNHGMFYKTEHEWKSIFKNNENRIISFKKDGKIQGYIIFNFQKQSESNFMLNNLVIKECVYATPEALLELSTFLNSQADQVNRIEFNTQDENIRFFVKDARNTSSDLIPSVYHPSSTSAIGLMYRIINVKGFIQQLNPICLNSINLKWKLTVTDSFFLENENEIFLHVKDGKFEIVDDSSFEVELKIDISELSSLFMGVVTLTELYMYGQVTISNSHYLNELNSIFLLLKKPICTTAF